MFGRFGYRVLTAEDGRDAVACLERPGISIDVVVTDMVMPNMDARALIGVIRRRWPHLPVLLSTGYDTGRLEQGDLPRRCSARSARRSTAASDPRRTPA
jgi:CheY-like chemotaxis protein